MAQPVRIPNVPGAFSQTAAETNQELLGSSVPTRIASVT